MSEPKFTPGPWKYDSQGGYIFANGMMVAELRGWGYLTGNGGHAKGLSADEAEKVMDANGALLEVAPKMYELLSRIYSVDPRIQICLELISKIPELLKEARGEK